MDVSACLRRCQCATPTHNHNNTMTTHQVIIDKTLSHKNWTGHSLADLIDAGRVAPKIENVMSYIRAACGEAENVEITLKRLREVML